jgi:hypothetical protein
MIIIVIKVSFLAFDSEGVSQSSWYVWDGKNRKKDVIDAFTQILKKLYGTTLLTAVCASNGKLRGTVLPV